MDDLIIRSKFSKEETIWKLKQIFMSGNEYGIGLQVLHDEYYLSSELQPGFGYKGTIDSFFLQFRIKEDSDQVKIYLTPQSKALSIAVGSMSIMLIWILLIAQSIGEKQWLEIEVYTIGLGITFLILLFLKFGRSKERTVIDRIKKEFE